MAPLALLLEAASTRRDNLDSTSASLTDELTALEKEVTDKRAEKTIASQNEVKELLKRKELLMQRSRLANAAANHVRLAFAKLQRAQAAGLQDWKDLKEERLKLSSFAKEQMQDPQAMASLQAASGGGTLKVEGDSLLFTGNIKSLPALKSALEALESRYSAVVEMDAEMLRLLESRGELGRMKEKHSVDMSGDGGSVHISGTVESVGKAEKALKWLLTGKADLNCPRELVGASKAQAKEVETETGSLIEVARDGFGGGGVIRIRGDSDCVRDAEERLRAWLDEREGRYSVFVEIKEAYAKLDQQKVDQFNSDLWHFGSKFNIQAQAASGRVELRGPKAGEWETPARAELQQILDFYVPQKPAAQAAAKSQPKAKTKAKAKEAEDDTWGAAPEADFELGHKW